MYRVWVKQKDVKLSPKVKVSIVGHGPTEIVSVLPSSKVLRRHIEFWRTRNTPKSFHLAAQVLYCVYEVHKRKWRSEESLTPSCGASHRLWLVCSFPPLHYDGQQGGN